MAVPQAQYAGSAPADVVNQAGQLGARWGEILQNSVAMGLQAHTAKMQRESQEKMSAEQNKSAADRLRLELMGQDLTASIAKDGPKAFIDRGDEIKEYFSELYGGAGEEIYEATAKNILGTIRPDKAAELGLFEYYDPNAGMQIAATAGQGTQASSIPIADSMAQVVAPAAGVQPQAPAAGAQVAPAMPTEDQTRTNFVNYLSQNMKGITPEALSKYSLQQLQKANPSSWDRFSKMTSTAAAAPAITPAATAMVRTETSGVDISKIKGIMDAAPKSGALTDSARSAISKIADSSMPATTVLTPKEGAALGETTKRFVRVARNGRVAQYMKIAGNTEALDEAARALNAMDPELRDFVMGIGQLSTADAKTYYQGGKLDLDAQKAMEKAGYNAAVIADKQARTALQAIALPLQLEYAREKAAASLAQAARAGDKTAFEAAKTESEQLESILAAYSMYANKEKQMRDEYTTMMKDQNKKYSPESVDKYIAGMYANPNSILSQTRKTAAAIIGAITGETPSNMVMQVGAQYLIEVGGFKLGQTAEEKSVTVEGGGIPLPGGKPQGASSQGSSYGVKPGVFDD